MSWDSTAPIAALLQQLLDLCLRTERLKLAARLQRLEDFAVRHDLPSTFLRDARRDLRKVEPLALDWVDRTLVEPPKKAVPRKRYVTTITRSGSIF